MKGHNHDHHHGADSNLKVAFFLNLGFTILEIIGGLWTNSIAILTDSVHDFGDSISLGLAWYFERLSKRGENSRYSYGYRRFRILGALITGLVLLVGLGFVLYSALSRLLDPQPVKAHGMIGLAILGVLFNGAAVLRIKKGGSLTEKMVSWHLIEDVLGWFAVLIGAGIMAIWDLPIVDPILSIGISVFVLLNAGRNLKSVFEVLLQIVPSEFDMDAFERQVLEIPEVDSIHHLHCWSIDGESHVLSLHIVLSENVTETATIKNQVRALIDREIFEHITLEMEFADENCPHNSHAIRAG